MAKSTISKKDYKTQVAELRTGLLEAQRALSDARVPVILILSGVDGAGKGEVAQRLTEWLDPRGIDTHAFWEPSDEERERPEYWRFWRALPPRGRIALYIGSWYSRPIVDRSLGRSGRGEFERALNRIASFERMLAADGAVILKFSLHLTKKQQRRRMEAIEAHARKGRRVLPVDWKQHKRYDAFSENANEAMRRTDSAEAPWFSIEAKDGRHRDLSVGRILLETLRRRLQGIGNRPGRKVGVSGAGELIAKTEFDLLSQVDLKQKLGEAEYARRLDELQTELNHLTWAANRKAVSTVLVFEGWDAAGKGSAIRRVTEALDPRLYRVIPIAAPTDEEKAHHYLWRFWRHLPRAGMVTIFDRSWYGRVLVERVEGFARPEEWMRAYLEINDFEEQLADHGTVIAKFWVHISPDEQLRRFKQREQTAFKRYKITAEDWRNRKQWGVYELAVNDLVARTSSDHAPWILVAGNDKQFARIQILKTFCDRLKQAL